jgi:hypothetical protein
VLTSGNRPTSFDLVNQPVRTDHVWAGGGADYVFMQPDEYPDVIRCGRGNDLVQHLGSREPADRYRGCERVERYSP